MTAWRGRLAHAFHSAWAGCGSTELAEVPRHDMSEPTRDNSTRLRRAHSPARAVLIGAAVIGICLALVFSPLLLGKGGPVKYIVAFGLAGFCLGASIVVHGTIDLFRNRK